MGAQLALSKQVPASESTWSLGSNTACIVSLLHPTLTHSQVIETVTVLRFYRYLLRCFIASASFYVLSHPQHPPDPTSFQSPPSSRLPPGP